MKILGLDLGTNSLGWAIVEQHDDEYELLDRGVDIFQEGVARDKNSEKPAVQDRTAARALRRHYFRRRLRKIEVLKVLIKYDMCPGLTEEQLDKWRKEKIYPQNEEFMQWQRTDDNTGKNPYHDRFRALTETLDFHHRKDRHAIGRAMYHIAQRRGFISNRKETGNDSEEGKVKQGISDLSADMAAAGCEYLGEYFYMLYNNGENIRKKYTSRNEHYLHEFKAICTRQALPDDLCRALERAIFYQRPLKSQKGLVGKCKFEKNKSRCPVSHPRFEEFRMLSYINNIRILAPGDTDFRPLSEREIETISPLFMRKSKPHFDFDEIAKKIAGKGQYACKGEKSDAPYRFNFARTSTVSGCPVTASLISVFGNDWLRNITERYTLGEGKSDDNILNDVWHALFSFDDDDKLCDWAKEKLRLSEDEAKSFASIRVPQQYASLSLNAINKILPYLRRGYRYDEAVFMANLKAVLPPHIYADDNRRRETENDILEILEDFWDNPLNSQSTKEQCICDYLRNSLDIDNSRLARIYHPSMIDTYPKAQPDENGLFLLGSPRTPAVRNPMAMRSLFRLRALINALLREGKIDRHTKINIEFSRRLNNANMRKAIEQYQREREAENRRYADEIRQLYADATGKEITPSGEDILKYRLWEEQGHICLYTDTDKQHISITDFIGGSSRFDIEHTVPRSRGGDDSQANKTLCEIDFNRRIKRNKLPAELPNHDEITNRIESLGWLEKADDLQMQIEYQIRRSKNASTKQDKDNAIIRRHYLELHRDYWRDKCARFTMTEIPEGFSNRQGVDIGIIGKYARMYLNTVFDRIYIVKGATTSAFRTAWGLQKEYTKKERINHVHHCIDAITIACIGRREYDKWAQYAGEEESYKRGEGPKPHFKKPWPTFTEDVAAVADELLVAHHTPDNMPKQTRKKLRVRGKIKRDKNGNVIYMQGDTARGALHLQTFYGAVRRDEDIKYVVRKALPQLQQSDVAKIVDDTVRAKVQEATEAVGFKTAMDTENYTIWMNEAKRVPIRKVRIYAGQTMSPKPLGQKLQRDQSAMEYKRPFYVSYGSNYCMAIYEGTDRKGQCKRSFEIVSTIEAAQYFKKSADKTSRPDLVPLTDAKGYGLKYILKTGTMVLFYEHSAEELYECSEKELVKRLYKLTVMSVEGRAQFLFHQEARDQTALKEICGAGASRFVASEPSPKLRLSVSNFNMLVEGYDFDLSVTGEIKFKR